MKIFKIIVLFTILIHLNSCEKESIVDVPTENKDVTTENLVTEMNIARTNPKLYVEILKEFKKSFINDMQYKNSEGITYNTSEGISAVNEAIDIFENLQPTTTLIADINLDKPAKYHREDTGPKGIFGHEGSNGEKFVDRFQRYMIFNGLIGENISYGSSTTRDIILQLIVDDGVSSRGHRDNILNPKFKYCGTAFGYHSQYNNMCVLVYSETNIPK